MATSKVRMIPFALIDDTKIRNPRTDLGNIEELVDSFKRNGQLQPIIVRHEHFGGRGAPEAKAAALPERPKGRVGDIYYLVAGQRRLAAIRRIREEAREEREKLGKKGSPLPFDEVMAVIRPGNEIDVKVDQLIENLHRRDLNPIETAEGIKDLDNLGYPIASIADRISRSEAWCRRLLDLRDKGSIELTRAIVRDGLPLAVAFTIAKKPQDEQAALIQEYKKTAASPTAEGGGRRGAKRKVETQAGKTVRMTSTDQRKLLARVSPSGGVANFEDQYINGVRDTLGAVLGTSTILLTNLDKKLPLPETK